MFVFFLWIVIVTTMMITPFQFVWIFTNPASEKRLVYTFQMVYNLFIVYVFLLQLGVVH